MDVAIIEIGGMVGDIESQPFLEALRQFRLDVGPQHCCCIHVTLVPYMAASGELKTKPTQHSVRALRDIGLQPDVIVCRTGKKRLEKDQRGKIALFCNVTNDAIINAEDSSPLYAIPLNFKTQHLDDIVLVHPGPGRAGRRPDGVDGHGGAWRAATARCASRPWVNTWTRRRVQEHQRAFVHAGIHNDCKVDLTWVDSEN